jgi:hypothetical protein
VWLHKLPFPQSRIAHVIYAAFVLSHITGDILHKRPIICHCRNHSTAVVALILKRTIPRFRFVFDMRGDTLAEQQALLGFANQTNKWIKTWKYKETKRQQSQAIENASQIICVSHRFREKIVAEYPAAASRVHIIPCVASQKLFTFEVDVRSKMRADLHLTNSIVIVYAGSLKSSWHIADIMANLFGEWHRRDERLHWLVVTHDLDKAEQMIKKRHLGIENVTVISSSHENVGKYMMAGDVGLLLRRPDPINLVASPTKFAEYIMTGLPVLASAGIGDLDELFILHSFGKIIDDLTNIDHSYEQLNQVIQLPSDDNSRINRMMLARSLFSAEEVLEMRTKIYQSILFEILSSSNKDH